jgi:anti-anti-sigma regulatory factor
MPYESPKSQIQYALADEGSIVIIRVVGRGNFELSPCLKSVVEKFSKTEASPQFLLDMEKCPTLDSTFMGMMAAMGMDQRRRTDVKMKVLHTNPTTMSQMEKLGLKYLLDIRSGGNGAHVLNSDFESAAGYRQSRLERMAHMIESHQSLIDAHSGNEIEFRSVLDSLNAGLEQELKKSNTPSGE